MPRKPLRRSAARSPRRRKNKHGGCLIFLILFAVIGLGMFLAAHKKANPDLTWPDVVEEALPETVRETVKEALPQTVREEIEKVRKKERKEIEKEKIEKIEKEEKQDPIRDHPVEEQKAVPPAVKKELPEADKNPLGLAPGAYKGRLAIVIDDCGYELGPVRTLTSLPLKMTFAVIPFKPNSASALSIIRNSGHTAMLHLPMEPVSGGSSETRFVGVGQTKAQIASFVQEAINSLPGIAGVNNHQGSKATAHGPTIRAALSVIGENGLFFIDSRTNSATVAEKEAGSLGIPTGHNSLFLDNSSDIGAIEEKIAQAVKLADRYGSVIVICHARPNTAEAWKRSYRAVLQSGITLVPAASLLQ